MEKAKESVIKQRNWKKANAKKYGSVHNFLVNLPVSTDKKTRMCIHKATGSVKIKIILNNCIVNSGKKIRAVRAR